MTPAVAVDLLSLGGVVLAAFVTLATGNLDVVNMPTTSFIV